jgi:pimeloyl-ACP methyl ester carboxylesterase
MLHSQKLNNHSKSIIFIHGNSQSLKVWDKIVGNEKLFNNYSLVTLDLPGHGKSFHSNESEKDYSFKGMAKSVESFLEQYKNDEYIIVALSIGTNFVAEIFPLPQNCKGLFFIGSLIIGKDFTIADAIIPNPNTAAAFMASPSDEEINAIMEDMACHISPETKEECKQIFCDTHPAFREAISNSVAKQEWSDETGNIENLTIPVALVYGAEEKIVNPQYLNRSSIRKWLNEIILIPNGGHCVQLDQPQVVAELINDFAKDCFK